MASAEGSHGVVDIVGICGPRPAPPIAPPSASEVVEGGSEGAVDSLVARSLSSLRSALTLLTTSCGIVSWWCAVVCKCGARLH